jgi:hypothetical protein
MDTAITWENDYQLVQMSGQKKAKLEAKKFQPSQPTPNLSFKPRIKSERFLDKLGKIYPKGSNHMP